MEIVLVRGEDSVGIWPLIVPGAGRSMFVLDAPEGNQKIPEGRYRLEVGRHPRLKYPTVLIRGVLVAPDACFKGQDRVTGTPGFVLTSRPDVIQNSNGLLSLVLRELNRHRDDAWLVVQTQS